MQGWLCKYASMWWTQPLNEARKVAEEASDDDKFTNTKNRRSEAVRRNIGPCSGIED